MAAWDSWSIPSLPSALWGISCGVLVIWGIGIFFLMLYMADPSPQGTQRGTLKWAGYILIVGGTIWYFIDTLYQWWASWWPW